MGQDHKGLWVALVALALMAALFADSALADSVTLFGGINESRQFETLDGEVINIDDGDVGEALKARVGKHVEVTGSVLERGSGVLYITVSSFKEIAACHGVNNAGRRLESAPINTR